MFDHFVGFALKELKKIDKTKPPSEKCYRRIFNKHLTDLINWIILLLLQVRKHKTKKKPKSIQKYFKMGLKICYIWSITSPKTLSLNKISVSTTIQCPIQFLTSLKSNVKIYFLLYSNTTQKRIKSSLKYLRWSIFWSKTFHLRCLIGFWIRLSATDELYLPKLVPFKLKILESLLKQQRLKSLFQMLSLY